MGKPIRKVTIVGGGTAGWLSALLLKTLTAKGGKGSGLDITLIESPNIPTVGVGEATVPSMPRTLRGAGISEQAFFRACNASFKLGVVFDGWNLGADGRPVSYINPFAHPPAIDGVDAAVYFQKFGAGSLDFIQTFSPAVDLAAAKRGPRRLGAKDYDLSVGFAYHLDAGKFAHLLRDVCVARGVRHVREDVVGVEQDERGYIAAVELKETGRHPVELVIDCTGFRGVIINQTLKEPFVSYSKYLANDRAMAVQVPHPDPNGAIDPVTRSTALGAGWSWRVPLYNRLGTGYVFSSAHRSDDQARAEFIEHLAATVGPSAREAEPRVIPMRIGRNRNAWVKNCVAVGLSGGFIEPLESTAIHMIDTAVRWLVSMFPDDDYPEPLRARYNRMSGALFDEVRDFICLHYALGNRSDDPYWIDARALEIPDSLAENLELWRYALPGPYDLQFASMFSSWTYQAVLLGKRVYETGYGRGDLARGRSLMPERWKSYLAKSRQSTRAKLKVAADHRTLLRQLRGEDVAAPVFALAEPGTGTRAPAAAAVPAHPSGGPDDPSLL